MNEAPYSNINDRLCSPQTYNFFGDLDLMIATGRATTEDAIECAKEIYDKDAWNIPTPCKRAQKSQTKQKRPPMYK